MWTKIGEIISTRIYRFTCAMFVWSGVFKDHYSICIWKFIGITNLAFQDRLDNSIESAFQPVIDIGFKDCYFNTSMIAANFVLFSEFILLTPSISFRAYLNKNITSHNISMINIRQTILLFKYFKLIRIFGAADTTNSWRLMDLGQCHQL